MIEHVGSLSQRPGFPYIYFIIEGRFLYIGETCRVPVVRWGEHFTERGSFWGALLRINPHYECLKTKSCLTAYCCTRIAEEVVSSKRKLAVQWVEHDLHVLACSDAVIGSTYTLISDTSRTAPSHSRCKWLQEVSSCIFEDLKHQINSRAEPK